MKKLRSLLFLSALAASVVHAQSPEPDAAPAQITKRSSLLFTAGEVAALQKALSDATRPASQLKTENSAASAPSIPNVYVSAVAQFGPNQWTVWANGYRIVPGRQPQEFQVLSVRDDNVEIAVPGDRPARFVLKPHQTWLGQSDSIVEGIVP